MPASLTRCMRLLVIAAIPMATAACVAPRTSAEKTRVVLRRGGDDGLTLRLADALEGRLGSSSVFRWGSRGEPGTLVVTIPTHVGWEQVGTRTRLDYVVTYDTADGRALGTTTGSCWEDELAKCADAIERDAEVAASRLDR